MNKRFTKFIGILALGVATSAANAGAIHDSGLFTTVFPGNDDGSVGPVALGFSALIGASTFTETFVNNNGNITFGAGLSTFTPSAISSGPLQIIAPFFADVDTRSAASDKVTYGTGSLGGRNVFGVNYVHVGVFSFQDIFNSFQMILTDRSDIAPGDFDIQFNYDSITWEAGTASEASAGGLCLATDVGCASALAGFWVSPTSEHTLPGSLVHGAFIDGGPNALVSHRLNSDIDGQYNFQVRAGAVVLPSVPEPGSLALLGLGLLGLFASRRWRQAV